jgi:hypothetical protein
MSSATGPMPPFGPNGVNLDGEPPAQPSPQDARFFLLNMQSLAKAVIKAMDIHEGHWVAVIRFRWGSASVDLSGTGALPTAFAQVEGVGLERVVEPVQNSVDAAEFNPASRIIGPAGGLLVPGR